MNQYFIDISPSMQPDQIISALNSIGYAVILNPNINASIHFVNLSIDRSQALPIIDNLCQNHNDKCILYTNGFLQQDVKDLFNKVVVVAAHNDIGVK